MPFWLKVGEVGKPLLSLQRIPGWPQTERWGPVARVLAGWAAPTDWPEFQQVAGVTPAQLTEGLQQLRANRRSGTEQRAMGELGWLLLTALRAQDEEVLRLQRALEGKSLECTALAEAQAVAQEVVTSQAERTQELTRQCEVLVARVANKRRLRLGRQPVTTAQVHAVTAAPFWDPEAWDGNIWGSSSSSEEEEEPKSAVAHAHPVRELRPEGGQLQPEIIRTFKTSEFQEIVKTFRQEPGEGVLHWLVRAWDNAGNTVMLLRYELQQLGVLSQDSQV
ncbi:hypothetical protein G0U57_000082 [Chelydra serpentina]|uniref:Uncharacterized protein n=1 Tax=Chelydra serpentina TaxID=8475 RepID=A0A8T1RUP7_CHESE|nr:hypothetical protein G0U57_000082 [Chelydra serpentina]